MANGGRCDTKFMRKEGLKNVEETTQIQVVYGKNGASLAFARTAPVGWLLDGCTFG